MKPEDKPVFMKLTKEQAEGLTCYLEARGEGMAGMTAVAFVLKNRQELWKQGYQTVVFGKNNFSCYLASDKEYATALAIASEWDRHLALDEMLRKAFLTARAVGSGALLSNIGLSTFYRRIGTVNEWFDGEIKAGRWKRFCEVKTQEFFVEVRFL
jgi:hypothetical protein